MKQKILFFITGAVGGAEKVSLTIAKMLDRHRYDIKIVILGHKDCELANFIPSDIQSIFLNITRMRENSLYKMYNVIKKENPSYVFSSLRFVCINLLLIRKFLKPSLRVVVRAQISPIYLDNRSWHDRLLKYLYPYAYKIVAQTIEMKQEMIQNYELEEDKVLVLQNPIDVKLINEKIKEKSPFENDANTNYVAVGRCVHQKGYDILINAFKLVVQINSKFHLYIVGSNEANEYTLELNKSINSQGLSNNIHFVGFNDNPYKYIINGILVEVGDVIGLSEAMLKIDSVNIKGETAFRSSSISDFNNLFA
jgi:glycosyltransferase involved in cell wall biosynthesis